MIVNWLDIFFVFTTVVSLVVNILQWRDRRAFEGPLTSSLVAVFNDIKAKSVVVALFQRALASPDNPHQDISTLRWEYGLFLQNMFGAFQGLQESVVGLLVTINPKDKQGTLAFRASDYGLTEQEKQWRDEYARVWQQQYGQPTAQQAETGESS